MKKVYKILSKVSLLGLLFFVVAAPTASVYSPPLIIEEADSSPSVKGVTKLIVTNGTLTKSGSQATLDLASLASSYTITRDAIGTTSTDGLVLENTTPAAAGAQQISPRLRFTGQGWKTAATPGSQAVDYIAQLVPVQGAANSQARLDFNYAINGGALQATPTLSLLNGNVGIGTTGPLSALNVAGTTGITWANNGNSSGLVTIGTGGTSGGSLWINTPSLNSNYQSGLGITGSYETPSLRSVININAYGVNSSGGYGSDLAFSTTNGLNSVVERMRIDMNGNVGIGTTTFGASAAKVLSFGGPATAPTTRPPDVFTVYPFDVSGAGTMGLAWMSEDNGIGILGLRNGFGTITPDQFVEFEQLEIITGAVTDGYAASVVLDPGYTAESALTVSRHNYFNVLDVSVAGAGPAAVTNAALFRFDAAIATHKALAAAFNTTDSAANTTSWAGGIIINVNGTLYKIPFIVN